MKLEVKVSGSPILLRGSDETEASWVCGIGFGVPEVPDVWKTWEIVFAGSFGSVGQSLGMSVETSFGDDSGGIRSKGMPLRSSLALELRFV